MPTPTPPPTPPSSTDKQNFIARADSFAGWFTTFYNEWTGGLYAAYTAAMALLGVANVWTKPQRAAIKNIPFAASVALDLASSQNFRITTGAGAWSIANPYCDTITCTVETVADSTQYTVTINGTAHNYTSGTGATAVSIAAGLAAAVNAGTEPVTATANGDGTYDLDADVSGTLFTLVTDLGQRNSMEGQSGYIWVVFDDPSSAAPSWPDPATTGMYSLGDHGIPDVVTGLLAAHYTVHSWSVAGIVLSWEAR